MCVRKSFFRDTPVWILYWKYHYKRGSVTQCLARNQWTAVVLNSTKETCYPHCSVLVGSSYGFELWFHQQSVNLQRVPYSRYTFLHLIKPKPIIFVSIIYSNFVMCLCICVYKNKVLYSGMQLNQLQLSLLLCIHQYICKRINTSIYKGSFFPLRSFRFISVLIAI